MLIALVGLSCSIETSRVTAGPFDVVGNSNSVDPAEKTPVLVELFTSEGCSSCPPAERLLDQIEKDQPYQNIEVITLALHVDYWDRLGWKDSFSSALFTRRQDIYSQKFSISSTYTPQMVVDGTSHFIGSRSDRAAEAITDQAKVKKGDVVLSLENGRLSVRLSKIPKHEQATIFLAFAEDALITDVAKGENSGKRLEHTSVVRELRSLGVLPAGQNELNVEQPLQFQDEWKKENMKLIVFVQENASRKVIGVNRIRVGSGQ